MFSIHNRSDIDQDIRRDIDFIVSAIDATVIAYDSIYLLGSFGRGEGTVEFDGCSWRGVNDYDLLVICPDDLRVTTSFKYLGRDLARSLVIDFVDVGWMRRSSLHTLLPTIENYDLKYASLLLAGVDRREEIPRFRAEDISAYEFVRLLCNRVAGLLTMRLPERTQSAAYCRNQYVKASIAVGDISVYLDQGYHPSYAARFQAFKALVQDRRLPFYLSAEAIDVIVKAYEAKLSLSSSSGFSVERRLMQKTLESAFCAIAKHCTTRPVATVFDAEKALRGYYQETQDVGRRGRHRLFGKWNKPPVSRQALKNLILFSQPFFFCRSKSGLQDRWGYFSRFATIPGALAREWSALSAVLMWEEYCH